MVAGLAFIATAIATLFANATAVRWSRSRAPHQGAWTVALALFALASAALATGVGTGWDAGTFRAFYLLGAIVNVPWLALGTVYLLAGPRAGRIAGAVWSAIRFARRRSEPGAARLMTSNVLIALGTLVLSSGGLLQGAVGKDEAFAITLAVGIVVIYAGFSVASAARDARTRRTTLPAKVRGTLSTTSTRV